MAGKGGNRSRGWCAKKGGEGLEITWCLFRMVRKLEGVKCASETQTLAHDTPVAGTGLQGDHYWAWLAVPGGAADNVWGL